MAVSPVTAILAIAGDTCGPVNPGAAGVGEKRSLAAVFSLTGTFTNAVVAIEAVPLAQPISVSAWVPIMSIGVIDGYPYPGQTAPLSSSGQAGSGFVFTVGCVLFQQLRMRLMSIRSGQIQAAIAVIGMPLPGWPSDPGAR